jgi:hypothetical protein
MKIRPSSARVKKTSTQDKINYLDEVQYGAAGNPGVGQYNLRVIFYVISLATISKA